MALRLRSRQCLILGWVALTASSLAAAPADATTSDWHGYQKTAFASLGTPAFVVTPKIAAPGKPWVLRTGAEDPAVDEELLRAGCHVARMENATAAQRGTLAAELKTRWRLAEKPVVAETQAGVPPFTAARAILAQTFALPAGHEYFTLRDGLANCHAKFEQEKTGRIAFLGGSITFNPGWRDELMRYFQQKYPDTKFDFIAAGIPSVGSVGHAFRLQQDVLHRGPLDLIFVEAAVNDHNYDPFGAETARHLALRGMEGVVRHLRAANPQTDIVVMHFIHDQKHLPIHAKGGTPSTIAAHEEVAAHYGCPSLNLSLEVADRIAAGQFTWKDDFRDLHPSPYGQRVYSNSMTRMLEAACSQPLTAKPHPLPPAPLDPASYTNGRYGKLEDAQLANGFILDPNWKPAVNQPTRPGFANCPALVAEHPGAELRYPFEGTAFGLFLAAGRDTGVIEYSFDGGPFLTRDTLAADSKSLHLPWPIILADDLKPGKHTVTLRTTDKEPKRTALHVIRVLLN